MNIISRIEIIIYGISDTLLASNNPCLVPELIAFFIHLYIRAIIPDTRILRGLQILNLFFLLLLFLLTWAPMILSLYKLGMNKYA